MIEDVLITIPAYNEEESIVDKVLELHKFVSSVKSLPFCHIVIADNNSKDDTAKYAKELEAKYENIYYNFVDEPGKGSAVKRTWLKPEYDCDAYAFMDMDLSAGLDAFPYLIEGLKKGYDLALGSRHVEGAEIERGIKRTIISLGYKMFIRALFNTGVRDYQCGFKAVNRAVRDNVMPFVESDDFPFDTEMIVKAYYAGYSITQVPVRWKEDAGSTVNMKRDIPRFFKRAIKLKCQKIKGTLLDGIKLKNAA
jgi:glycosyltransferase involved in cell wall biosynthesis